MHIGQIWNMKTGSCFVLRGHTDMVNSVLLWDGSTSPADRAFNSIVDHNGPASSPLASESSAKFIFSASDDGTIKLWDLASKTCLRTYSGHTGQVRSIRLLVVDKEVEPDGSEAETQSGVRGRSVSHIDDGDQRMLDNAASGPVSCSAPFAPFHRDSHSQSQEHASGLTSTVPERPALMTSLPDDKRAILVSGALDNTVKVWDVESATEKSTLFGHIEGVWAVDIDSLRLASASHGKSNALPLPAVVP